ncbi:RelA/SpoT family protein [Hydrogenophaga sp. BPS33]|uniref:RelA/SpoT family protein n=1 Tax=Hydrogenophaga sp. BPS33 TaxID=2651974 RepID=UPI0013200901|nr:bifunctional (p)ppGpp synthetase/guanosine-3',5'-bis(diphosphate) 3'-pyrophosphohydrolase [Hydrogenophaga sp. BPS33]QHE84638.1 bifunctional (p)ppGpp synthetase/guanosine-3',5'-bis(diphosphate) 3'-pyrophosphohydrolase [Hydrogenophaga sp. BPS33]
MSTEVDNGTLQPSTQQAHPAASAAAASFAALLGKLDYLSPADIESIRQAYRFADEAHLGQLRKNGDPYITHPIAVAAQCAEWKLDAQALMAALMHDAIEDCGVTKEDLVQRFGSPVADLVDGLTKLEKLEFDTREQNQAESFRKMLLAMAKDVRVILIKLADRTHNMRTMGDMPRSKWKRISSETLEIYAPIAHRLGLNFTYRELQDLAFRFLHPWRYEVLSKASNKSRSRRRDLIARVQREVEADFVRHGMSVRIMGREKTLYSIYRKMDSKHLSFSQVTDIYGFRIIVPELSDCYTGLGVLHQLYKPLPGKFRDYVAIPKVNGYQSLHTTLIGPFGTNIEFQLRTHSMDVVAESGVAAHWLYKASDPDSDTSQRLGTQWLQSLLDIQQETHDAAEFWDHIKIDLFPDAVYVFTPKSKIMALPRGATVMDFAYAIHSDVGNHTVSARINGEQRPLRTELANGDVVEIVTAEKAEPNPTWLSFVKTGRARSKIRHHLKTAAQEKSHDLGERMLSQALRSEGIATLPAEDGPYQASWEKLLRFTGNKTRDELLADIGMGKRIANMVGKKLAVLLAETGLKPDAVLISTERYGSGHNESVSQGVVTLDGSEGSSVQYAPCCKPIPGDRIVGYLGRGEGLVVHADDCPTGKRLRLRDGERFLEVEWADEPVRQFDTTVVVTVTNGKGVLARVAASIAAAEADITHVDMGDEPAQTATDIRFLVAVRDRQHLADVLRNLKRTTSVIKAQRYKP